MRSGDKTSRGIGGSRRLLLAAAALALSAGGALAQDAPQMSPGVKPVENNDKVYKADPSYQDTPYDPTAQINIYGGKYGIDSPRPLLELGQPLYIDGPLDPGVNIIGRKNLVYPAFEAFGDWRSAIAFNDNGNKEIGQV